MYTYAKTEVIQKHSSFCITDICNKRLAKPELAFYQEYRSSEVFGFSADTTKDIQMYFWYFWDSDIEI